VQYLLCVDVCFLLLLLLGVRSFGAYASSVQSAPLFIYLDHHV
jgi:hypothetical protein